MSNKIIISNGTIVTLGNPLRVIPDGAVLIAGNLIEKVGPRGEIRADGAKTIDAAGGLVMPGFINAHMHLYSTFACGISLKTPPPSNFVEILERLWWKLDKALALEDVRYSAVVVLARCLKAGTTTIIDHHASPHAVRGSLDTIAKASLEVGVRSCLCYELSDRDGPEIAQQGIDENVAFIKACRQKKDPMLAGLFGLHASMTIGPETMARAVEASKGLGTGFHVHTSESRFDPEDSLAKYGKRVVNRLADAGVLGDKTICAHCIHLDDAEVALLRDTHTNVVHNPQSNMNNAVGAANVLKMLSQGVLVGLGSDGMTANMFDEMRCANLIHKHVAADPRVAFLEAARMLIENNAAIASKYFPHPVGALAPGHLADVIVLDYDPPTPLSADNFLGHLVFGLPNARVTTTIVDGRVRLESGRVLGIDEHEVAARSRELAAAMWKRF
ncbi:MAG TPA: putative aminohydrolase SsnA [Phycisphaerae bacterium]|nr:putative aminohydrolase SsnA [Phycisphaerae bacterium]